MLLVLLLLCFFSVTFILVQCNNYMLNHAMINASNEIKEEEEEAAAKGKSIERMKFFG